MKDKLTWEAPDLADYSSPIPNLCYFLLAYCPMRHFPKQGYHLLFANHTKHLMIFQCHLLWSNS